MIVVRSVDNYLPDVEETVRGPPQGTGIGTMFLRRHPLKGVSTGDPRGQSRV